MSRFVLVVFCVLMGLPQIAEAEYRRGFIISEDENFGLRLNGRVEVRYEFLDRDGAENLSSFYMRRLRLDFRGNVHGTSLSFRIVPDFSRTATLTDGYLDYRLGNALTLRAGQMTLPFQRQRSVSSARQHFSERSDASEQFGMSGGRDIGVMLQGSLPQDIRYSVGIYDGAGRNVQNSNSDGNLLSARLEKALVGSIASDESDLTVSKTPNLTVGLGFQGATKNELRNWSLGRAVNRCADYNTGTVDIHFALSGFSTAFDYYVRSVDPEATDSYTGGGFLATAGYYFGGRHEVVASYSSLKLDNDDDNTERNQLALGMNIYHKGHNHKTRINYFRNEIAGNIDNTYLIEAHVSF